MAARRPGGGDRLRREGQRFLDGRMGRCAGRYRGGDCAGPSRGEGTDAEPPADGNPVFSVVQTDIIHYGDDLADYFANEFGLPLLPWARSPPRHIAFWSELVELNNG